MEFITERFTKPRNKPTGITTCGTVESRDATRYIMPLNNIIEKNLSFQR
jgi:hypothetical protein